MPTQAFSQVAPTVITKTVTVTQPYAAPTYTGLEDGSITTVGGASYAGGVLTCASGGYAYLPENNAYDKQAGVDLSIMAKFKTTVSPTGLTQTIVAKHNGNPAYEGWVLQLFNDDIETYFNVGSSNSSNKNQFSVAIEQDVWYSIVMIFSGTNSITIFINGVRIGTQTAIDAPPDTTANLYLGAQHDGTSAYNLFTGEIKDVVIVQGVPTPQEIKDHAVGVLL